MTNVFEHDFEANLEKHEEKKTIDDILNELASTSMSSGAA